METKEIQEPADIEAAESGGSIRVVLLIAGGQSFGIAVRFVREVIPYVAATPLPGSADYVSGLINLRGQIVTVVSLGGVLGLARADGSAPESIVLVEYGDKLVGLEADRVVRILQVPVAELDSKGEILTSRAEGGDADPDRNAREVYMMVVPDDLLTPLFS